MDSLVGCSEQSWRQSLVQSSYHTAGFREGNPERNEKNQIISDSSSPKISKHFSNHHMSHKTKYWFSPFIFSNMILYLEFPCCTKSTLPKIGKQNSLNFSSASCLIPFQGITSHPNSCWNKCCLLSPQCGFTAQNTLHISPCVRVGRKGKFGLNVLLVI